MMKQIFLLASAFLMTSAAAIRADQTIEMFRDYVNFSTYNAGIIRPDQLSRDIIDSVVLIDTRSTEEFEFLTIPGAINIEWRDIFDKIAQIPTDKTVVLFCNTGALSAQATFGLRTLGYENVLMILGGFDHLLDSPSYTNIN